MKIIKVAVRLGCCSGDRSGTTVEKRSEGWEGRTALGIATDGMRMPDRYPVSFPPVSGEISGRRHRTMAISPIDTSSRDSPSMAAIETLLSVGEWQRVPVERICSSRAVTTSHNTAIYASFGQIA